MQLEAKKIEEKWKKNWKSNQTYKVLNDFNKPKYYVLDMFPYPSGAGLHVGHPLGYIASDIYARYKRQSGYNVLHPMGFDAFGLPAEQYAIQTGVHPEVSTAKNIAMYKKQLENIGFNYDWSREVNTSDPKYYRWTQWIFLQLFNHYYDLDLNKAMPIEKLISAFESEGNNNINASTAQTDLFSKEDWGNYSNKEKDDILMNYRLAYLKIGYVNWCEALGTVLANDEVKDGLSERGGYPVERRAMKQWSLRITAYAERLLNGLNNLTWSDALKTMQRNWIGRSEGAQVFFEIEDNSQKIEIFTTRPDTIYGATFMVLAPEHELVEQLVSEEQQQEISQYLEYVSSRSDRERMTDVKKVTGAFTGSYAINPFTNSKIPIYIAEYVLKDYGTGAIMAVPSDDERDHRFAEKFGIPIIDVIDKSNFPNAKIGDKVGTLINSDTFNGMNVKEAIQKMFADLTERGIGRKMVNYKLRDANFSRQRYWGEPIPVSYNEDGVSISDGYESLPLELPALDDFKPASGGHSPLARAVEWVQNNGKTRETDTMPGFAGSSWYFLRYMDAMNSNEFASKEALSYWKEVDLYVGGTEHAVGHLMYSRFWHKFLYDLELVPTKEPFKKLINQGMIQGVIEYLFLRKEKENGQSKFMCAGLVGNEDDYVKIPIHVDYVSDYGSNHSHINIAGILKFMEWRPEYKDAVFECSKGIYHQGKFTAKGNEKDSYLLTHSEVGKMSKRYFNVVNPDDVIDRYGADCFRMYEMFLGPVEQSKPWDTKGIDGVWKFLNKFQSLYFKNDNFQLTDSDPSKEELKILHSTIKKVTKDIENFSFNTAVSSFMICVNDLKKLGSSNKLVLTELCKLIAPFAPFISEELWSLMGNTTSVHHSEYPIHNDEFLVESEVLYPICINGKKRLEKNYPSEINPKEIEEDVMKMEELKKWYEGKQILKVIIVPKRMVNLVVK